MARQTRSGLVACVLALAGCGELATDTTSSAPKQSEEPARPSTEPVHEAGRDESEPDKADAGEPAAAADEVDAGGSAATTDDASAWNGDASLPHDAAIDDAAVAAAVGDVAREGGAVDASCSVCGDRGALARDGAVDSSGMEAGALDAGSDAATMDGAADGSARPGVGGVASGADGASADAAGSADAAVTIDAAQPPPGTFARVYQLLHQRCRGCHVPGAAYSLDLSQKQLAYDELVGGRNMGAAEFITCSGFGYRRVVPGAPTQSLLWQKLRGVQPCGDQMPPGDTLDLTLASEVEAWIVAGAPND